MSVTSVGAEMGSEHFAAAATFGVSRVSVASGSSFATDERPSVMVPRSQMYYWTRRWQDDEAESVAELARGEGVRFDSARDAIAWLLSD